MRTLIFGSSGQVATELSARAPSGATIVALSRTDADLSDPAACADAIARQKPQIVINAAAYTAVDKAEDEEALATLINGTAPTAMATYCAAHGIPFLHISTDYVFDGSGETPWTPDAALSPLGAYGRSKMVGEDGIRASGGVYAILRTSWVFSAHGNNFVKTMLRLSETRDHLTVVADQIGGPTAAADIADALWSMAEAFHNGRGQSGTYHFSGKPNCSWADFAREVFAQSGHKVTVEDIPSSAYPTPAARPANSRLDCGTLAAVFGIERPNWKTALANVLADLKETA